MSDSVRPHRRPPIRLPRPWDSPGKNTGVGCHFLLQCMKVKSESEVTQSCLTLRDPMNCSPPGSSVNGSFQARVLEWRAIAFSALICRTSQKTNTNELNYKPGSEGFTQCNELTQWRTVLPRGTSTNTLMRQCFSRRELLSGPRE